VKLELHDNVDEEETCHNVGSFVECGHIVSPFDEAIRKKYYALMTIF